MVTLVTTNYKTEAEVITAWNSNKKFQIENAPFDSYFTKKDMKKYGVNSVYIIYGNKGQSVIISNN